MLNKFTSNTKRLNKIITGINFNNLLDLASVTASLEGVIEPEKPIQAETKISNKPPKIVSTKKIISDYYLGLTSFAARYITKDVTTIVKTPYRSGESILNKLIIENTKLDYGSEEYQAENFEVFIDGLHTPGIFSLIENGNNVEIVFNERWIIDDRVEPSSIKVFGKFKEIT